MSMSMQAEKPSLALSDPECRPGEGVGTQDDQRVNPMHRLPDWRTTLPLAQSSPRCGARTRSGNPCRSPAMPNGRCRMHGGASTGPRTAEGIEAIRKARAKHGRYSAEMAKLRSTIALLQRMAREVLS